MAPSHTTQDLQADLDRSANRAQAAWELGLCVAFLLLGMWLHSAAMWLAWLAFAVVALVLMVLWGTLRNFFMAQPALRINDAGVRCTLQGQSIHPIDWASIVKVECTRYKSLSSQVFTLHYRAEGNSSGKLKTMRIDSHLLHTSGRQIADVLQARGLPRAQPTLPRKDAPTGMPVLGQGTGLGLRLHTQLHRWNVLVAIFYTVVVGPGVLLLVASSMLGFNEPPAWLLWGLVGAMGLLLLAGLGQVPMLFVRRYVLVMDDAGLLFHPPLTAPLRVPWSHVVAVYEQANAKEQHSEFEVVYRQPDANAPQDAWDERSFVIAQRVLDTSTENIRRVLEDRLAPQPAAGT